MLDGKSNNMPIVFLPLECRTLGEECRKNTFTRCCDPLICQIEGFFKGKCVKCLPAHHVCLKDSDCCSGKCHWYRMCADTVAPAAIPEAAKPQPSKAPEPAPAHSRIGHT